MPEIAEGGGEDAEKQRYLVGPKPVAGEPGPVGGGFALLERLLRLPALVVEMDDGVVRPGARGDNASVLTESPRA